MTTSADECRARFDRASWIALASIVMLALVLRVVAASITISTNDPKSFRDLHGDAAGYLLLAERISRGEPYASREPTQAMRALVRPPGYPALLAAIDAAVPGAKIWRDARPIVWPQVLFSTLAVAVAFVGVRAIFRRTLPAAIAATLVAVNPTSVAGVAIAMPDALHGSCFGAAFVAFTLVALRPGRWARWIAVTGGVALAAGVALKPASMYWPACALPMLLLARGPRRWITWLDAASLFVPTILIVGAWTAHNAAQTGVATYSTVAARNLRYDVVPRVNFLADKGRFPTRKEYERGEAREITTRDRDDYSRPDADLAMIDRRMKAETRAAFLAHPWATVRVAFDNVCVGSMVRWQRSDRQFRGDGALATSLRAMYAWTEIAILRGGWYALILLALPIALARRDRAKAVVAAVALVAFCYVMLGITTIPSEGSRLLAAEEVPAALLVAITVTSIVDVARTFRRP